MKCPYRITTITEVNSIAGINTVKTEFSECYHSDCPWYIAEHYDIDTKQQILECCQRCITEHIKATRERNLNIR